MPYSPVGCWKNNSDESCLFVCLFVVPLVVHNDSRGVGGLLVVVCWMHVCNGMMSGPRSTTVRACVCLPVSRCTALLLWLCGQDVELSTVRTRLILFQAPPEVQLVHAPHRRALFGCRHRFFFVFAMIIIKSRIIRVGSFVFVLECTLVSIIHFYFTIHCCDDCLLLAWRHGV